MCLDVLNASCACVLSSCGAFVSVCLLISKPSDLGCSALGFILLVNIVYALKKRCYTELFLKKNVFKGFVDFIQNPQKV
jgi:hypothetical protein